MLQLSEYESFLTIFSLQMQQIARLDSKISSDQKRLFFAVSLYPL